MQRSRRDGIGSPLVLSVLAPVTALGAGAAGLLVGGSLWWGVLCAVLVPWALCLAVGVPLVVVASRRSPRRQAPVVPVPPPVPPPVQRAPAAGDQLVADLVWQGDQPADVPVDLPRKRARQSDRAAP